MTDKLSTDPYKGVRDFYPEDMAVERYIFDTWRTVAERYGYEEYNASILEPAELYRSKTSEEIVNEQTYTFTDRGEREVTLRPEMTPTVARMVAARKRELAFPLRWYSIPNVFRYERPQRGRMREHWQLNADIFGVEGIGAEVEIVSLAYDVMKAFGADDGDFEIRVNDRRSLMKKLRERDLSNEQQREITRLLDAKDKMPEEDFNEKSKKILGEVLEIEFEQSDDVRELMSKLSERNITNVAFSPTLARGFDYYFGIVFEIFDTHPDNNRSLFGGGRYDNLLELFGGEPVPAVGFGMGDVTIRDFLETHDLLPSVRSTTDLMLCTVDEHGARVAFDLARTLRDGGVNVMVYEGDKKVGDQIKIANKKHIPHVVCLGEKEAEAKNYLLKDLSTGDETPLDTAGIITRFIKD